ncbi:MAG: Hsp70 family protein [Bacteroidota bacterium]
MKKYGIDLGTTNSAIARFEEGEVTVLTHPVTNHNTLASVVAYQEGSWTVGEKARELYATQTPYIYGNFKRKMGTADTYVGPGNKTFTPEELSAEVLKELKTWVTEDVLNSAVITIPASFDTVQSNATQKAGELGGFVEVKLLQEPVAASLAYANTGDPLDRGKWLVYDLGGGTFDVALVSVFDGEMRVVDHVGDNYLGGADFDRQIVEKILVPELEALGHFPQLIEEMRSAGGKYHGLYQKLLILAEEAKKELTDKESAEIAFDVVDQDDRRVSVVREIKRSEFDDLIRPTIEHTVEMIHQMLAGTGVSEQDLQRVLMVGGSTYIPLVKSIIEKELGVPVDTSIDPTTAVAVGAAYFAASQLSDVPEGNSEAVEDLDIKLAYAQNTQEVEVLLSGKASGAFGALFYRITRKDGGYDSGQKPLKEKFSETLPLVPASYNVFELVVRDVLGNKVETPIPLIEVSQGGYGVIGQPLPHDICLEVDDVEQGETVLESIFEKNATLPLRQILIKRLSRTIPKGSDERLTINILEGDASQPPAANQSIGIISISGKSLTRDLIKGSDVELSLHLNESRELAVTAYLMLSDQEFHEVFRPAVRRVSIPYLVQELARLSQQLDEEVEFLQEQEGYELAHDLLNLQQELLEMSDELKRMPEDDTTDVKYQIDDKKRELAAKIYQLTIDRKVERTKLEFFDTRKDVEATFSRYSHTPDDKQELEQLLHQIRPTLTTNSPRQIRVLIDRFLELGWKVRSRNPEYLRMLFYYFISRKKDFKDPIAGRQIIAKGENALQQQNYEMLKVHLNQLAALLPEGVKKNVPKGGTGIA